MLSQYNRDMKCIYNNNIECIMNMNCANCSLSCNSANNKNILVDIEDLGADELDSSFKMAKNIKKFGRIKSAKQRTKKLNTNNFATNKLVLSEYIDLTDKDQNRTHYRKPLSTYESDIDNLSLEHKSYSIFGTSLYSNIYNLTQDLYNLISSYVKYIFINAMDLAQDIAHFIYFKSLVLILLHGLTKSILINTTSIDLLRNNILL